LAPAHESERLDVALEPARLERLNAEVDTQAAAEQPSPPAELERRVLGVECGDGVERIR
jgi:hypothetical protein